MIGDLVELLWVCGSQFGVLLQEFVFVLGPDFWEWLESCDVDRKADVFALGIEFSVFLLGVGFEVCAECVDRVVPGDWIKLSG